MPADILSQIIQYKKTEIKNLKHKQSEAGLRSEAENYQNRRSFKENLAVKGSSDIRIIAEIKRASPSKGDIRADLNAALYAAAYEKGGASAISVLTEQKWFKGNVEDLKSVKKATSLPVLRKDFIISTYQLYESAAIGADAVLLIARILDKSQLSEYLDLCDMLKMDSLVEIHTMDDLEKIQNTGARLIGINNRNLKSFNTDISVAMHMSAKLGPDQIAIAASGINTRSDIDKTLKAGIHNFLIGESIVRSEKPEIFIRSLLSGQN
jgi:indole-3-glycerol phosphate synthase